MKKLKSTERNPRGLLMFAYGSNLSVDQMMDRCPAAKKVGPLEVNYGLLTFRGTADVMPTKRRSDFVPGGLWRITEKCEDALDRFEGYNPRYPESGTYVKRYLTLRVGGRVEDCLLYMSTSKGIMPPEGAYIDTIAKGYADFGIDTIYLEEALLRSWDEKNKTPDLRQRWVRRGKPSLARARPRRLHG